MEATQVTKAELNGGRGKRKDGRGKKKNKKGRWWKIERSKEKKETKRKGNREGKGKIKNSNKIVKMYFFG